MAPASCIPRASEDPGCEAVGGMAVLSCSAGLNRNIIGCTERQLKNVRFWSGWMLSRGSHGGNWLLKTTENDFNLKY